MFITISGFQIQNRIIRRFAVNFSKVRGQGQVGLFSA